MSERAGGKLKIFLGFAAGVGKTYQMLEEAQELKQRGVDVLVGYFEPHGRKDTIALMEGLEMVPRRKVEYRGAAFEEMDTEAILARKPVSGVTETVPTYRSLLVHYDPVQIGFDDLGKKLLAFAQLPVPPTAKARRWRIPVAYGGEHGIDLEDVARTLKTTPDDIVARHIAGDYRVAMIGFTPGWSYLSGLEDFLHMPRRSNPRLLTPAGTISIGGVQAGIQCLAGPSGWHLLGRTAVRTYQLHREPVFLLEPGDHVTFSAVDAKTFDEQDRAAERGEIIAELIGS